MPAPPLAVVGGRLATGLVDLTSDLGALDGPGFWAVVIPFEGPAVCARFEHVRPATPWPGPAWSGPARGAWRTSLDRDAFCAGVAGIRAAIAAGDVYQVNLTRRLSAPAPAGADVAALGAALAAGNPAPYSAVVRIPAAGVHVASASPERFLSRSGRAVESRPIKGTAATAGGFLAKDRAENVMIVDLVRNDLGRVCEYGSVEVAGLCEVEPHPGLFHLVSTVRGRLRPDAGWPELVEATFPPGSVTGAPKLAALDMIAKLETVPRGPYCGAVGWVDGDAGAGDLNVAIRTLWLEAGEVHLGTGGGITWDSTPEGEWDETELKARRLLEVVSA
ncbi:MAG: chorismate-binding protein [Actinomycetota bacterium]